MMNLGIDEKMRNHSIRQCQMLVRQEMGFSLVFSRLFALKAVFDFYNIFSGICLYNGLAEEFYVTFRNHCPMIVWMNKRFRKFLEPRKHVYV